MQLTQREMAETHMIVTTPEKWDVITRKGGDVAAAAAVRLLIMDEVDSMVEMVCKRLWGYWRLLCACSSWMRHDISDTDVGTQEWRVVGT